MCRLHRLKRLLSASLLKKFAFLLQSVPQSQTGSMAHSQNFPLILVAIIAEQPGCPYGWDLWKEGSENILERDREGDEDKEGGQEEIRA